MKDAQGSAWATGPKYLQHSAHIEPGREGLFDLVKKLPATLNWMHGVILAEDDFVFVHSRYSYPNRGGIIGNAVSSLCTFVESLKQLLPQKLASSGRTIREQ